MACCIATGWVQTVDTEKEKKFRMLVIDLRSVFIICFLTKELTEVLVSNAPNSQANNASSYQQKGWSPRLDQLSASHICFPPQKRRKNVIIQREKNENLFIFACLTKLFKNIRNTYNYMKLI